jgi:hypothetical protein
MKAAQTCGELTNLHQEVQQPIEPNSVPGSKDIIIKHLGGGSSFKLGEYSINLYPGRMDKPQAAICSKRNTVMAATVGKGECWRV